MHYFDLFGQAEIKMLDTAIAKLNGEISDLSKQISKLDGEIKKKTAKREEEQCSAVCFFLFLVFCLFELLVPRSDT